MAPIDACAELADYEARYQGIQYDRGHQAPAADAKSAQEILDLLETLNQEFKKTIVMVTHDPRAAQKAHVQYHLDKGELTK